MLTGSGNERDLAGTLSNSLCLRRKLYSLHSCRAFLQFYIIHLHTPGDRRWPARRYSKTFLVFLHGLLSGTWTRVGRLLSFAQTRYPTTIEP